MRILLVRLRLIGDVVFTTPLIRALRRHFPHAHLTYVVEEAAAPVVRANPHLDELIVTPKRRGLSRLREDFAISTRLHRGRFDIAIDLHGGPRGALLTWASGAPMRIGYVTTGRTWMYTHRVPRPPDLAPRHAVANQWDLLTPLGIPPGPPPGDAAPSTGRDTHPDPSADSVEMMPDLTLQGRLDRRLHDAGIAPDAPMILIHVSAGNAFRRWPAEAFESLAVQLVRTDPSRRVILFSGPSQPGAARQIAEGARRQLGALATAIPMMDEPELAELHLLMARAAVYIGGDSGPAHVAATTATPIVTLLGPTLPERSRPWRHPSLFSETVDAGSLPCRPCSQRVCQPGDFRCLTWITPDRVAAAAERAMHAGPNSGIVQRTADGRDHPDSDRQEALHA